MNSALIAQLLAMFGPPAIGLIKDLIGVWAKPSLTKAEVLEILAKTEKSYDTYVIEARIRIGLPPQ